MICNLYLPTWVRGSKLPLPQTTPYLAEGRTPTLSYSKWWWPLLYQGGKTRRDTAMEGWGQEEQWPRRGQQNLVVKEKGPEKGSSSLFLVTKDFHPALLRREIKRKANLLPRWFVVSSSIGADSTVNSMNFSSMLNQSFCYSSNCEGQGPCSESISNGWLLKLMSWLWWSLSRIWDTELGQ